LEAGPQALVSKLVVRPSDENIVRQNTSVFWTPQARRRGEPAQPGTSGILNLGSGKGQIFIDIAYTVSKFHGEGKIEYIPFPGEFRGRYQSFTEAETSELRAAGYDAPFCDVEDGVMDNLGWLHRKEI
jgi:hypothetical protein